MNKRKWRVRKIDIFKQITLKYKLLKTFPSITYLNYSTLYSEIFENVVKDTNIVLSKEVGLISIIDIE